jgi:F0F1-type ATP synthase assembly protein I
MTDPLSQNDNKQNYGRWLGFGIEFAGVVGLFCYMGYKLDEVMNASPWFLLAGFFVGFIGMFYLLLKEARNSNIRGK